MLKNIATRSSKPAGVKVKNWRSVIQHNKNLPPEFSRMAFHESVELGPGKKSGTCWIREGNMAACRCENAGRSTKKGVRGRSSWLWIEEFCSKKKDRIRWTVQIQKFSIRSVQVSFFPRSIVYIVHAERSCLVDRRISFERNRILPRVLPIDRANLKNFPSRIDQSCRFNSNIKFYMRREILLKSSEKFCRRGLSSSGELENFDGLCNFSI